MPGESTGKGVEGRGAFALLWTVLVVLGQDVWDACRLGAVLLVALGVFVLAIGDQMGDMLTVWA